MGFFNCCSLVGHSALGAVFFGTEGAAGASGASGFLGGATGGGSGAFVSYSNLFVS
jgi:hypothetical protein